MINMKGIIEMNINIIPLKEYSQASVLLQTKRFCYQQPTRISRDSYFYYEDILFSVLKKEVQISTLCEDICKYDMICNYIEYVFSNKTIGVFGNCNKQLFEKVKSVYVLWV